MKKSIVFAILYLLMALLVPLGAQASTAYTLVLPSALKTVEAEAFRNDSSVQAVVLPDGVTTIGAYAFAGSGVKRIYLPASIRSIADNAFSNCSSDLVASVIAGSYAYNWCVNHGINVERAITLGNTTAAISTGGQRARLCFIPSTTGEYTLTSTGSNDTYVYLFDDSGTQLAYNDDGGLNSNFSLTYWFIKGRTYYFEVEFYDSSTTGSINMTLSTIPIPNITVGTTTATINTGGASLMYRFVPSRTGSYTLKSTGSYDTVCCLYDAWNNQLAYNDDDGESSNFSLTYELTAGSEYFYEVQFYSDSETGSFPLVLSADFAPSITQQPASVTVFGGSTATFSVKAKGTGTLTYQWQIMLPTGSSWQNTSLGGNRTNTLSFTAQTSHSGSKFRCIVADGYGYNTTSDEASLTVIPTTNITMGTTTATINTGGASLMYRFVPSRTGSYTLKSTGSYDTVCCLYDAWNNQLAYNDDDGESSNFSLTYELTAGSEYFYEVQFYSDSETGSFPLVLSADFAPSITQQPASVTVFGGSTATFSVKAKGTGTLTYQWQIMLPTGSSWQNTSLGGNRTNTLSFTAQTSHNGSKFRCIVTDGYGYNTTSDEASLTVQAPSATVYRALLIGNNNYMNSPLNGCIKDMNAMAAMLSNLGNRFSCTKVSDATAAQMRSAISSAFSGATTSDVSLFYYSGHGMEGENADGTDSINGALVGVNYSSYYPDDYLTPTALASALSQVPGRVIVLLDSCRSGAAIGKGAGDEKTAVDSFNQSVIDAFSAYDTTVMHTSNTADVTGLKYGELATSKFIVITACKAIQDSLEVSGRGLFTSYFIEGCGCTYGSGGYNGSMPADKDGNNKLTVSEIYDYTKAKSSEYTSSQTVQCYAANLSEVMFWR